MSTVTISRAWSPSGLLSFTALRLRERYFSSSLFPGKSLMRDDQLLLRIEKYPHRMNFNKGILESRRLHYKHLYKLLVGPSPLNE